MSKKLLKVLLTALILAGCETGNENVVRVCVNYGTVDNYCGTGFFIESNMLVTAKHIVAMSINGRVTVVIPGFNVSSSDIEPVAGKDIVIVKFSKDVTDNVCPVCEELHMDVEATALRVGRLRKVTEKYGRIDTIENGLIKTDMTGGCGFSGGPLIDEEHDCVAGVTYGVGGGDGLLRASILAGEIQ